LKAHGLLVRSSCLCVCDGPTNAGFWDVLTLYWHPSLALKAAWHTDTLDMNFLMPQGTVLVDTAAFLENPLKTPLSSFTSRLTRTRIERTVRWIFAGFAFTRLAR